MIFYILYKKVSILSGNLEKKNQVFITFDLHNSFIKFGLNASKRAKEPSQAQLELRKRSRQKSSKAEQTKLIKQCT